MKTLIATIAVVLAATSVSADIGGKSGGLAGTSGKATDSATTVNANGPGFRDVTGFDFAADDLYMNNPVVAQSIGNDVSVTSTIECKPVLGSYYECGPKSVSYVEIKETNRHIQALTGDFSVIVFTDGTALHSGGR